jgi:hypothetical protein
MQISPVSFDAQDLISQLLRLMEFEDDLANPARTRSFKPGAVDRV